MKQPLIFLSWLVLCVKSQPSPNPTSELYAYFCSNAPNWGSTDDNPEISIEDTIQMNVPSSNIYDTYNADECKRVRRPWNILTTDERQLYIDGLLELRKKAKDDIDSDELIACASPHDNTHHDSDYLFWHGYLVWELESRIRNLGGKFRCFGMPYWDFTNEHGRPSDEEPFIFRTGLGGYGDPNDYWKVNGYSWDVTTPQYWTPYSDQGCAADGDQCPVCSLKRPKAEQEFSSIVNALEIGEVIDKIPKFKHFQPWIKSECGLPDSVDNSYDPIWFLFHSMESYYRAMWVNCHGYDLIDAQDLDKFPMAFNSYCSQYQCVDIGLDDPLQFGGVLAQQSWSYIHNNELTIRKLYQLPQWNVIYDLNGDPFFTKSKLQKTCKGRLNPEWFIFQPRDTHKNEQVQTFRITMDASIVFIIVGVVLCAVLCLLIVWCRKNNQATKYKEACTKVVVLDTPNYGSMALPVVPEE